MNYALVNFMYTIGLLLGMLFLLKIGRRTALRRTARDTEGALLALLGLLIAFSFSGAAARFDARRSRL